MAAKKKPSGWNSLTPAQQAAWKKKNFNMKVKVTEAQLNKLRAQGTPAKAIAKYKNDPSMREALNRFYGKARVDKAAPAKPVVKKPTTPAKPVKMGPDVKGRFNRPPAKGKDKVDLLKPPSPTGNIGNQINAPYPTKVKPTTKKPTTKKATPKNPTPKKLPSNIYDAPRPSGNIGNQIAVSKKPKRYTGRGD